MERLCICQLFQEGYNSVEETLVHTTVINNKRSSTTAIHRLPTNTNREKLLAGNLLIKLSEPSRVKPAVTVLADYAIKYK